MIPLAEARERVLARCERLPAEWTRPAESVGLVVAEAVVATEFVPPFANTAMDGFAVLAADTRGATDERPVTLEVVGTVAAGSDGRVPMRTGQAIRIMTGAPMPPGADAVVMVERCRPHPSGTRVDVCVEVPVGNHVRSPGEDLSPGDVVVEPGTVVRPGHVGVLAGLGLAEVAVFRRPRVAVFSTGDELVEGPGELRPGQIRDSNRHTLVALLHELGCEPVDLGIVPDEETILRQRIHEATTTCDALVTSGGVSMGDFDLVKKVLGQLGDMEWMQVAIRPAKPLAVGTVNGVPVFGLPGNPVSSMVSFELFARPGLRQMMGHADWGRRVVVATVPEGFARSPDGKTHFARVRLDTGPGGVVTASSAGGQGSHQLSAMAAADGLAVVPDGDGIAPGGEVPVIVVGSLTGPLPS
jgi:molybdopterin molybdotransferase